MRVMPVLVALSFAGFLTACDPKPKQTGPVDFPHQASDIAADPAVIYGKLENGLRYAVMQNDTPTKTAAIRLRLGTGSLNETDEMRGLAHFLEHMAFNGSKNIPEGEMIKRLERFGLAFGPDTNAYTSFDETVYMLDLPEVSDEIFNETMMILRETASNLTLAQSAIDGERGVVQSEKRNSDSPGARASLAQLKFFSEGSRIYDRLPIGTDETLASINADLFRQYYDKYYRPENAFMVIVGDVEPDYAAGKIAEYFSDWQGTGEAGVKTDAGTTPPRGQDIGYFSDPDIQTSVTLAVVRPYEDKPDTAENRKQSMIAGLGNRILNRRFATLARKADADFIGAGGSTSSLFETAEMSSLSVSSRPENWERALAAGEQELRKALEFGFTRAELDEQLANTRKSLQVSVQTAETRRTGGLTGGILNSFSGESVFSHPTGSLERFETYVGKITPEQVWREFKTQWEGLDEPLLYLQTSAVLENPETEILKAYQDSRAIPVTKNADQKQAAFAYTDFGTPGKIAEASHIEDIDAHLIRFENNVLLNFKKTDFAKDSISIIVRVGDGALSMPRKDFALKNLAGQVLSAGGLEAHNADDISRLMAGKAVGAGYGIGTDSFYISGATVPSDLEDQFNLMTAYLTAPGFRDEAKARYDKYIESWYPTLDSTPNGVSSRDVSRLLRSGDKRYGIPSMEELLAVPTSDVSSWITPHLKSGPIEIAVVGDVDKDVIIEQVARTFGALPKRETAKGEYPGMTKIKFPRGSKKPVTLTHSGDANRALLQVFWPAPDGTDVDRVRRLGVLRNVLRNRLTDVVREDEAAAYSPSAGRAGGRIYKGYGYMSTSLGLVPEKVPAMIKVLDDIAEDLRAGNISDDEFTRAIEPILENLDSSLESNSYWTGVIGEIQTDKWSLNNFRTREATYKAMKREDLLPLAAQIFQKNKAYRVQVLPGK